jgi:hypothetical protein
VIITDENENKIAIFQGMVYRKTPKPDASKIN